MIGKLKAPVAMLGLSYVAASLAVDSNIILGVWFGALSILLLFGAVICLIKRALDD